MFSFSRGATYQGVPSEDKSGEEMVDVVEDATSVSISIRKALILIAIVIPATFVTVFSAVGAAIARQAQPRSCSTDLGTQDSGSTVYLLDAPQSTIPPPARYDSCGHSPAEARSRGCRYDIMSSVWLTPECYDDSLEDEFINWSNWTWYISEDPNNHTEISLEQAKLGETDVFVNWHYR